ncbi:unnamed protein product [Ilex paraguariensis]|uniref:Uncharacterized protein n=1 Tax=Ilex paraguariensis TaxID=185542 RepID=A0ABC8URW5_9AQUA
MKPVEKLRNFALHKSDAKEKKEHQPSAHLDGVAQVAYCVVISDDYCVLIGKSYVQFQTLHRYNVLTSLATMVVFAVRSGGCSISSSFKVRGCSDKSWQKPGGRFSGSSVGWAAILLQYLHFAEKFNLIRLKGQEKCDHPRRSFTHVLPTPADAKRPNSRINTAVIQSNPTSLGGSSRNLWEFIPTGH